MMNGFRTGLAAMAVASLLGFAADAKTFRFANDGDVSSMDPYARNETFLHAFMSSIYEPLVRRDKDLKLEGALAQKWTYVTPTLIRFDLRPGVTEVFLHPAVDTDELRASHPDWAGRVEDHATLCHDPAFADLLDRAAVTQIGYRELRALQRGL